MSELSLYSIVRLSMTEPDDAVKRKLAHLFINQFYTKINLYDMLMINFNPITIMTIMSAVLAFKTTNHYML